MRCVRRGGDVDDAPAVLPGVLEDILKSRLDVAAKDVRAYLAKHGIPEGSVGGSLDKPVSRSNSNDENMPFARYFLIHDTSSKLRAGETFDPAFINTAQWIGNSLAHLERGKTHIYINRLGESLTDSDYQTAWRATKFEMRDTVFRGLCLHHELVQPRMGAGASDIEAPIPGFTQAQYDRLALLYVAASVRRGDWLIPSFHGVLDLGIGDHDDPQRFDLQMWAASLAAVLAAVRGQTGIPGLTAVAPVAFLNADAVRGIAVAHVPPAARLDDLLDGTLRLDLEAGGYRVADVTTAAFATPAVAALTIKGVPLAAPAEFGAVYGKIRVTLGSPASTPDQAKTTMQNWLAEIAGTSNTTYSVALTIQKAGTDVLKAVLATTTLVETKFLGISIASDYTSSSTTGGILVRGLLVNQGSNDLTATLQILASNKITFNADAAGKAADAYKSLSVQKLVPIAASLAPEVAALAQLVGLFFPASFGSDEKLTVPLQFIPLDQIETKHIFRRGSPIATVSLELDDTLFSFWDGALGKFKPFDPDKLWGQAIFLPTGKHAKDLLRDDLPNANQSAKAIKKFISDVESGQLVDFARLDKAQQDQVGPICDAIQTTLLDYFTPPDAAAILWSILYRYSTTLRQNGDYMSRCLTGKIKNAFNRYGLPLADLA